MGWIQSIARRLWSKSPAFPQSPSQAPSNVSPFMKNFEGREAIYIEKGVLRVRVSNIRRCVDTHVIRATVEEIPTAGFQPSLFDRYRPDEATPLRWEIGAGFLTTFSDNTWAMGYGGWSLFFSPGIVSGLTNSASAWPAQLDAVDRYNQALQFLMENRAYERTRRVFPA